MKMFTRVEPPGPLPCICHTHRLMLLGSCFATNIGACLSAAKFRCDVNPFGVLYNPLSISVAIRRIMSGEPYREEELFFWQGCWHSPMHHGDFSAPTPQETLSGINERLCRAHDEFDSLDFLLVTWGTAWVYEYRATGLVAGNCHKRPERDFLRRRLSVDEVVSDCTALFSALFERNRRLSVVLTVSPIRHVRDGLHANQLSKSVLLLAAECLQEAFPGRIFYFPAYELLLDELRDYRFYSDDLVHPSSMAVEYVWERFVQWCVSPDALPVMEECESLHKALGHRPLRPASDEYKRFLEQIVLKIERLKGKYPYLDLKNEAETCHTLLSRLHRS